VPRWQLLTINSGNRARKPRQSSRRPRKLAAALGIASVVFDCGRLPRADRFVLNRDRDRRAIAFVLRAAVDRAHVPPR